MDHDDESLMSLIEAAINPDVAEALGKAGSYWSQNVDGATTTLTLEMLNKAIKQMEADSERFYEQQAENYRRSDRFRQSIPQHLKGDMVLEMAAHKIAMGAIWSSRAVEALQRYADERQEPMGVDEFMETAGPLPAAWFFGEIR